MKIAIIGCGFSGTMTAVHLIKKAKHAIELILINDRETFNKGFAYNPYSQTHLLNVVASKMSAFADDPYHFLKWVIKKNFYDTHDINIVANSFLSRYLYGQYLADIWKETLHSADAMKVNIKVIYAKVTDLHIADNKYNLYLNNGEIVHSDVCVIATGNHIPRNPEIKNKAFFNSKLYFQNPWEVNSIVNVHPDKPMLIIGNGLTMVDTVLGLLENGFENEIYSMSPNGFNILPHRHNGLVYTKLIEELKEDVTLNEIVELFNKHIKLLREFGLSAEPIIDSIRPYTQVIWQRLSTKEKRNFMSRFRHLWGVARHRIPLHIHDKIQQLRISRKLHIYSVRILDLIEEKDGVRVVFFNKKRKRNQELHVSRVINCTGPETDLMRLENNYLKNCLLKGIVEQDELKLGINADPETFEVLDKDNNRNKTLYTIGTNLKGVLWESTAVNELKLQAERLATKILSLKNIDETEVVAKRSTAEKK